MKIYGVLLVGVVLASCHGGGGGDNPAPTPPAPTTFTIGGTVSGLAGSGLELRNNAGNPLAVSASGAFTFAGTVASGSAYSVTVSVQPTGVSQTCAVAAGSGTATANVTSVAVTCTTNTFPVNVTVDGLFSGLTGGEVVLQNSGGNALTLTANGPAAFSTNVASGAAFNVTVSKQPSGAPPQTCTVTGGTGTIGSGPTTAIPVNCRAQAGRFVYVAVAGPPANGVAGFSVNATTGALTPLAGSPFPATGQAPRFVTGEPTGKFIYVWGDDFVTAPGATTITGFKVDATTGALTAIPGMVTLAASFGSASAVHPNGGFLFAPTTDSTVNAHNQLRVFSINPTTGELTETAGSPYGPIAGGEVLSNVVLSPNGANLYLASTIPASSLPPTGRITQFAVNASTGALTVAPTQATDASNTFNQLFMHPAGTHMYTRNSSTSVATSRFTLDTTTGTIGARLDIPTAFGLGAVISAGHGVYFPEFGGTFAAPLPGSMAGFVDVPSGGIGPFPGSPYPTGGTGSTSPTLDPTGRFISLINFGSHNVTILKIDKTQHSLAPVPGSPMTPAVGTQPGTLTFDPSGRFAYQTDVATAGSISSYAIDVDTGKATFVTSNAISGVPGGNVVKIMGLQ